MKTFESAKSNIYSFFTDGKKSIKKMFMKEDRPDAYREQGNLNNRGVVILHIHGGGFVAMSSASHQAYTRQWANSLDIPIFSIDYRLSPGSHFPDALNDCWQVYYWLLEEGEKNLGIKIDNIILAGDSAGGNLCASLTLLCIKRGYKLPSALVLSYPAAYVGMRRFVPSLLLSLDDPLLPCKFLKHTIRAYHGNITEMNPAISGDQFYLMSPDLASSTMLSKFPQTLVQVSENDPLRDFGALFAVRLKKAGVDVQLSEYQDSPHGLLNMNSNIMGLKAESKQMIKECENFIKNLLLRYRNGTEIVLDLAEHEDDEN